MTGWSSGRTCSRLRSSSAHARLLFIQPLQAMLPHFGQADAVQGFSAHLEGVLPLLLLPLQSLLVPSMEFVECIFTLAFCF